MNVDPKSTVRLAALVALLVGGTLVVSQLVAYDGIRRATTAVARGEAERVLREADRRWRELNDAPDSAALEAFLVEHEPEGLRYIAVQGPIDAEAGVERMRGRDPLGAPRFERGRVRLAYAAAPPPPGRRGGPRRGPEDGLGPPGLGPPRSGPGLGPPGLGRPGVGPWGPRRAPPVTVVELEPRIAMDLLSAGERSLAVSFVGALGACLAALAFRRVVAQREALRAEGERDRRLAALGTMSSVLAHEIRNPLASLKGHAQLLVEALGDAGHERARAKAERVVAEAVRIEDLTNSLLEFVRTGEIHREDTSPSVVVRRAVAAIGSERVVVNDDRAPQAARLDPLRMGQVIENLARNALEASEESGAPVEIELGERGSRLIIAVRDRGVGIAMGAEEQVFEPFFTTRVRGTGLGLAIARRIVEQHGGIIVARRREDGGTEVVVDVPRGES